MILDLGDCVIRAWEPQDAASLARNADNPRIAERLRDRFPHPYTVDHARRWIEFANSQEPVTHFALVAGSEVIGGVGLDLQPIESCRVAEIGYWVAEPWWGRGIGSRAVRAFSDRAFGEFGLIRLYATVLEGNPASERVLQKAGFSFEGRLRLSAVRYGRLVDQLVYSRFAPGE